MGSIPSLWRWKFFRGSLAMEARTLDLEDSESFDLHQSTLAHYQLERGEPSTCISRALGQDGRGEHLTTSGQKSFNILLLVYMRDAMSVFNSAKVAQRVALRARVFVWR